MEKLICFIIGLLLSTSLMAAKWKIVPDKSSLTFTATQNGSPVTGEFKKFNGDIDFDATQLNTSHAKIVVDTGSVSASYGELVSTLKATDWFDVSAFPKATFTSTSFSKLNEKTYVAKGNLVIRDKSVPITITFKEVASSPSSTRIQGQTSIKRNQFGIGQGEWAATDEVKDEVTVNFDLTATAQ